MCTRIHVYKYMIVCVALALTHVHRRLRAAERVCALFDPQYRYPTFQVYLQCQRKPVLPFLALGLIATLKTRLPTLQHWKLNIGCGLIIDTTNIKTFAHSITKISLTFE